MTIKTETIQEFLARGGKIERLDSSTFSIQLERFNKRNEKRLEKLKRKQLTYVTRPKVVEQP